MSSHELELITVLVVDDEPALREAYRSILEVPAQVTVLDTSLASFGATLFGDPAQEITPGPVQKFNVSYAHDADSAVRVVQEAIANNRRFDVIFLDMRMPPGNDGLWAATQIRLLDPTVDIIFATAYSDVNPRELASRLPPADKLFYVQKPFHPHEIHQLALALGGKSKAEEKIQRLAYYDSLTRLPNRELFRAQFLQAVALAERRNRHLAVMFVDLDNFKRINDTLGHSVGDDVLKTTAARLQNAVRSSDAIVRASNSELARLGGDEFVLLLSDIDRPASVAHVAQRIIDNLAVPLELGQHSVIVTPSIGIAIYPQDGTDMESLFKAADLAMYNSKQHGRNTFNYYTSSMNSAALKRMTIEGQLRGAVDRGEMSLHFQPQVGLTDKEHIAFEALLRWESRELGSVPPLEFIPVAEETGLILEIGPWVLTQACLQAKAWIDLGLPVQRMAINVSPVQFAQPNFVAQIQAVLAETGLPPELLELELTEGLLMKNIDTARDTLTQIKALRVQIAIDDFGTGYSSMNYLKQFPIDRLKIDKTFVRSLQSDVNDQAITRAIIAMAAGLNLRVTAEGVENDQQLSFLRKHRCDDIQGYYLSRPMTAAAAANYLIEFSLKLLPKAG
jgi:diguanylate cyclase